MVLVSKVNVPTYDPKVICFLHILKNEDTVKILLAMPFKETCVNKLEIKSEKRIICKNEHN